MRADINSSITKLYRHPLNISYYKRICIQNATKAGVESTFFCVRTFNNEDDENTRYLVVIIKRHAYATAQTNYQRCCHANLSSTLHNIVQTPIHYIHNQQIGVEIKSQHFTESS